MRTLATKFIALLVCQSYFTQCAGYAFTRNKAAHWSRWSQCSVTCGQGTQTRVKSNSVETRNCVQKFCPGYMDWPRFHFVGSMVVDSSTVNNIRCNYNNRYFTSTALSRFTTSEVSKEDTTITRYKNQQYNWNPMGSGHVYFVDSHLTALCTSHNNCDKSSTITETLLRELERAQMVNPDADKQSACEIWGLTIQLPGILQAKYRAAGSQQDGNRNNIPRSEEKGYAYGEVGRFKSKLENITWHNPHYQNVFKNATSLSMTLTIDLYNQVTRTGRISGTIGVTSHDDPLEQTATRILKPVRGFLHAPFYVYEDINVITLDLSASMNTYFDGTFKSKNFYLALNVDCRFPHIHPHAICSNLVISASGLTYYLLEDISSVYLGPNEYWYKVTGGVIDVSISHLSKYVVKLIRNHRIGVLKLVTHSAHTTFKEYLLESTFGINIGVMDAIVKRLNVGQTATYTAFASAYGRPLGGADVKILRAPYQATLDCDIKECSMILSEPADALLIESSHQHTNTSGMNAFRLTAVKDPGYLRCGVDGQLYAIAVKLNYQLPGKTFTFLNTDSSYMSADVNLRTIRPLVRMYNQVPVKKCPGWLDIEAIFQMYYNLYPVMWVNGIINLHSYLEVKQKARLLKLAMFETDFSDPKYMPASRDLSLSKQQLIWNWMECEMPFDTSTTKPDICSAGEIESGKRMVIKLLETAVNVELATIPPYFTTWLSLKTEETRNLAIALQIKGVYTEEMLHMSLAGNLLNSVGGTVNLTNMNHLPAYPTTLGSGTFFDLAPTTKLTLERFSIGVLRDVFTRVEKPSSPDERKVLLQMAELWQILSKPEDSSPTSKMKMLLDEYEAAGSPKSVTTEKHLAGEREKLELWEAINAYALEQMQPQMLLVRTIGGLYNKVLVHIAYLESCLQIERIKAGGINGGTFFIGDVSKQLNMTQWYDPSQFEHIDDNAKVMSRQMSQEEIGLSDTKSSLYVKKFKEPDFGKHSSLTKPLFPVVDLRTAIQAVIEIVYQGEGGSPCSLFRTSKLGESLGYENSHYAKFWEIVRGRKLKQVDLSTYAHPPVCLDVSDYNCPKSNANNTAYCFVGKEIPFDENGVWPIISNPGPGSYAKGTDAYVLDRQFNVQYTRMLWCLQDVFAGKPFRMRTCLGEMYDLIITGKKLVSTPIKRSSTNFTDMRASCNECYATPTWIFTRDLDYRAGLDLDV